MITEDQGWFLEDQSNSSFQRHEVQSSGACVKKPKNPQILDSSSSSKVFIDSCGSRLEPLLYGSHSASRIDDNADVKRATVVM